MIFAICSVVALAIIFIGFKNGKYYLVNKKNINSVEKIFVYFYLLISRSMISKIHIEMFIAHLIDAYEGLISLKTDIESINYKLQLSGSSIKVLNIYDSNVGRFIKITTSQGEVIISAKEIMTFALTENSDAKKIKNKVDKENKKTRTKLKIVK